MLVLSPVVACLVPALVRFVCTVIAVHTVSPDVVACFVLCSLFEVRDGFDKGMLTLDRSWLVRE